MEDSRWWSACAWGREAAVPWIGGCNLITYFSSIPLLCASSFLQPSYRQANWGGLGTMILHLAVTTEDRKAVGAPRWRKKRRTHSGLPPTENPNNKSSQLRGCRRAVNFWIRRIGPNNTNRKLCTIRRLQMPTCLPKRLDQRVMLIKHDAQRVNGLRIRTSPALTNGPKKIIWLSSSFTVSWT
jgi:hypothetical protein